VGSQVPPSGGSLEIGNPSIAGTTSRLHEQSSPFGGIPRNWKHFDYSALRKRVSRVPPSGGSLEIGNIIRCALSLGVARVPPSGGSLEIGNKIATIGPGKLEDIHVPPSGGSLEIGNALYGGRVSLQ